VGRETKLAIVDVEGTVEEIAEGTVEGTVEVSVGELPPSRVTGKLMWWLRLRVLLMVS
jgi:hypothetical protein